MSVGERITELRKIQNISQVQLAKSLQISRQAVSKWENDQSLPDTENMIRLAEVLDTDIEYLSSGRRTMGRRPPVVLEHVNTVEVVKEVPVPVVYRTKCIRNPIEFAIVGLICFVAGLFIGLIL